MLISPKLRANNLLDTMQPIELYDQELLIVEKKISLCVILTNDLSCMAVHANHLASISCCSLDVMRRFGPAFKFRARLTIFNTFIKSVFYIICSFAIWENRPTFYHHVFDRLWKCYARYVLNGNNAILSQIFF